VTAAARMGIRWKIGLPKQKTPEHRDVEEGDDGTHRNFPVGMRNHLIPSTAQETLRRFPKVGVNNVA